LGRDWNRAFFDIWVFSPSHRVTEMLPSVSAIYKKNEQEKKRAYDQFIREVEHGVSSTSGGRDQQPTWPTKEYPDCPET